MFKRLWAKLKVYIKPFLNWKFLISFGTAWMITNGWAYVLLAVGTILKIKWMIAVSTGYIAFLFLPFTAEKIITIPLAMWLQTIFFKRDEKTARLLEEMKAQAKEDWEKIKGKLKKKGKK